MQWRNWMHAGVTVLSDLQSHKQATKKRVPTWTLKSRKMLLLYDVGVDGPPMQGECRWLADMYLCTNHRSADSQHLLYVVSVDGSLLSECML
jgi:hypothetical protein